MKIHRINPDNDYHSLLPVDPEFFKKAAFSFKPETPATWGTAGPSAVLQVRDPRNTVQGNFSNFVLGCFTCDQEALESPAGQVLLRAGWMLPAVQREPRRELHFINITEEYDSFDRERSEYEVMGSTITQVRRFEFRADRIGPSSLFKDKNVGRNTTTFAVSGRGHPSTEFYHQYHACGLKGLSFEEVWSDGG